ncbi:MAG: YncE family protein [Bradymonadaceae bacterium]
MRLRAHVPRWPTRYLLAAVACLVPLLPAGCGPSPGPSGTRRILEPGPAVCSGGPRRPSGTLRRRVAATGATGNAVHVASDDVWVVESGSNTVSQYDPATGRYRSNFVDLGNGRNPFDLAVDEAADRLFITNFLADSVAVADADTGEVLREVSSEALDNPQGIAVAGDHVYVTSVQLQGSDYGPGSIAVFDRDPLRLSGTLEAKWKNPQYARRIETPDGPRVAVVDSGAIEIDGGRARSASSGGLELWRPDGRAARSSRETFSLDGSSSGAAGTPGRPIPLPNAPRLYVPSGTSPVLFTFDLRTKTWTAGASDPIEVYDAEGNALLHAAVDPRGIVYVSAFNRDALYLIDSRCGRRLAGPIDLGKSPDLLEGAHSIATTATDGRTRAYFLMTRSHVLGRTTFDYGGS